MNVIHMKYAKQQVKDMPNPKNDEWMQRTLTYTKFNV